MTVRWALIAGIFMGFWIGRTYELIRINWDDVLHALRAVKHIRDEDPLALSKLGRLIQKLAGGPK